MADLRLGDGLLNVALLAGGVLVLVLLYGFASRAFTPRTTPTRAEDNSRIKVEVRNGSGADGIAGEATAFLRRRGFDVVGVGNADLQRTSSILVRAGTEDDAHHVAGALGMTPDHVETGGPINDYSLDLTVYLGADYAALAPFRGDLLEPTD